MNMFKNNTLMEIGSSDAAPAVKLKQLMLFTILDGYVNGQLTDQEFLQDINQFFKADIVEHSIDEAKYNELLALQNVDINWVEFMEETDTTTSAKE